MMKRIVLVVQAVALVCAAAFVVLLFANEPETVSGPAPVGAALYADRCSGCHGPKGAGGVGPSLVGVAERIPDVAVQLAVVTSGRARMPAFDGQLTAEEIAAVVAFTRTGL